jgi:hypothetical protein
MAEFGALDPPDDELRTDPIPGDAVQGQPVGAAGASGSELEPAADAGAEHDDGGAVDSPAHPDEEPNPDRPSRRWKVAAGLLVPVVLIAGIANTRYPPIAATLEDPGLDSDGGLELVSARLHEPIVATIGSFGVTRLPTGIESRGEELLIRLTVSPGDCGPLEARLGGSCGRREPALDSPPRFTIRAPQGELEALVSMEAAPVASIDHSGSEPAGAGPREWSLVENAAWTVVKIRCLRDTDLAISRLPARAHPTCTSVGPIFKLLVANPGPDAQVLSFNRARSFKVRAGARRAAAPMVDRGVLTVGGAEDPVGASEPSAVALEADGSGRVDLTLKAPAPRGESPILLESSRASGVLVDDEDRVPSLLARNTLLQGVLLSFFIAFASAAILAFALSRKRSA